MILYLGNKLSKHGFTPTSVETLGPKLEGMDFVVVTRSSKRNILLRVLDMLYAVWKFKKQQPVVLIDTYSTSAFWYAYASAILCGILKLKYISILRGGDLPFRLDKSPGVSGRLFNNSFANVAVSGYLHHEFKSRNMPVITVHNYIELENYPFTVRSKIQPRLLWVRAFHKIYNPVLAVKVFKTLKENYPGATLCMVGPDKDGSLNECKKISKEWQLDVTFTGRLTKPEWIALSKDYDIFINTTDVDNTPVSVMEAMALGMPVVTTNAGGIPFLFDTGTDGIMVNKNNIDEMTTAIIDLVRDPLKTESISNSARLKAKSWDWKVIGPQWKKLLESAGGKTDVHP